MNENDKDAKKIATKSKLGHRRITEEGTVTYKKKTTSDIQKAIQLGIKVSVTRSHQMAKRDMLLRDFGVIETMVFPKSGSKDTPPHELSDFKFKTFAPIAFRFFRDLFQVNVDDYLESLCHKELRELSNAGASGSIFYITQDDEFIIKTVQHKEASFLQKLLPEYYINLIQHPRTLLPKFYGLYCYQTMGKNIRFIVMNNLLPSITIHEKYDLKGSTYKRVASVTEKEKSSPTLKDLDFRETHKEGLFLEVDTYEALLNTISRDCRVLESFSIMDYSLLLGIHNLDKGLQHKGENDRQVKSHSYTEHSTGHMSVFDDSDIHDQKNIKPKSDDSENISTTATTVTMKDPASSQIVCLSDKRRSSTEEYITPTGDSVKTQESQSNISPNFQQGPVSNRLSRTKTPFNRQETRTRSTRRIAAYSTVIESIQAPCEPVDLLTSEEETIPTGGIPARNKLGDRLILFLGIIDILQSYRLMKRMEHNMKAIFLEAETISVCCPTFYAQRFQDFFANAVFKKIPSSMRNHPEKLKHKGAFQLLGLVMINQILILQKVIV